MAAKDASDSNVSALEANIAAKGKNAYYFAHATNLPGSERLAPSFGGAPPLLSTPTEDAPQAAAAAPSIKTVKIAKYSWSDNNKSVKVYIDWAGADELPEGAVQTSRGDSDDSTTAQLTVTLPQKEGESFSTQHKLVLTPLYEPVAKVTAKCSAKRITLTLHKEAQFGWPDLKAKKK